MLEPVEPDKKIKNHKYYTFIQDPEMSTMTTVSPPLSPLPSIKSICRVFYNKSSLEFAPMGGYLRC